MLKRRFLSSAHLPTASTHPNVQSPLAATTLTSNSSSISPSPAAVADVSTTSSNSESSAGTLTPDAASQTSALGSTSASTVACSSTDLTTNPYPLTAANLTSSTTSSTSAFPAPPCCDNGRPMITDPVTGQSVCSCQYEPNPSSRLAALGSYSRLTSATPITAGVGMSVFGSTYPSNDQNPYPSITVESATPFYTSLNTPYALKDSSSSPAAWTSTALQPSSYYAYDPTFGACGYGANYDLAARRKNATRESTATLKAWLNEHMKNPYPTKGEKIMLAIITKMTLTQVSTWFANARRRLKKENKMTWEPKNRTEDEDALVSDDEKEREEENRREQVATQPSASITPSHVMPAIKRLDYDAQPPPPPALTHLNATAHLPSTGLGISTTGVGGGGGSAAAAAVALGFANNVASNASSSVGVATDLTASHSLSGLSTQPKDPYHLVLPQNLQQYSSNFYYPNTSQHQFHHAAHHTHQHSLHHHHHHPHHHHHHQQQHQQQQHQQQEQAATNASNSVSSSSAAAAAAVAATLAPTTIRSQISYDNTSLLMPAQHQLLSSTYSLERR
ncbi:uncharacterized protein ACN427_004064 isoform 2-T3 [Glossina fuscipes fuscipes]